MTRCLIVLFATGWLLATFSVVLMQYFALAFDYYFSYIPLGGAVLGIGFAMAVSYWRGKTSLTAENTDAGIQWIAASVLACAGCMLALLYLPIGPIYLFLVLVGATILPFILGAYGVRVLIFAYEVMRIRLEVATIAGVIVGLLSSQQILDYAGGAIHAGWVVCAALSIVILLCSGRRSFPVAAFTAVILTGLTAYQIEATRYYLPPWVADSPYIIKPTLGALSAGDKITGQPIQWDSSVRIDLLERVRKGYGYDTVMINGASVFPVVKGKKQLSWWRERFPLVTIPLSISGAESILSVGPAPGPEGAIAELLGMSTVDSLAYYRLSGSNPVNPSHIPLLEVEDSSTVVSPVNIRSALREDDKRYDLIFLPLTHPSRSGWIGSNAAEGYFYTQEAITQYWSRLNEGGMLVVTTRDEALFARMVMMLWEMLEKGDAAGQQDFSRQAWGVRLLSLAPYKGDYQYLTMLVKGTPDNGQLNKLQEKIKQMPVEALFGPGVTAARPYTIINRGRDYASARERLMKVFSQRFKAWVDLRAPTDQRPYVFHLIRDAHPYLKWLLSVCLGVMIAVLMFPLAHQRRTDVPGCAGHPPLPVLMGYFVLLGGAMMVVIVGVMQQIGLWSAAPVFDSLVLLASIVAGFGVCAPAFQVLLQLGIERFSIWSPLALIMLIGLTGWLIAYAGDGYAIPYVNFRLYMLAVLCLLLGLAAGLSLKAGVRLLEHDDLKGLVPWVWIVVGMATLAGTVLANWLAMLWGWHYVWMLAIVAWLSVFGAGIWMQQWIVVPAGKPAAEM